MHIIDTMLPMFPFCYKDERKEYMYISIQILKYRKCSIVVIVLSWKSMDGFGGMQSMNLLKLHANICMHITCIFSGAGFHNTHLIFRVQPSSFPPSKSRTTVLDAQRYEELINSLSTTSRMGLKIDPVHAVSPVFEFKTLRKFFFPIPNLVFQPTSFLHGHLSLNVCCVL